MKKKLTDCLLLSVNGQKILLKMKLTLFLILAGLLQVSATVYSQNTKFSLDIRGKQVAEVLKQIEEESNFRFFYQREQVDVTRTVNLKATGKTVEEILDLLFEGEGITYKVLEDNLVLLRPEKTRDEENAPAQQQKSVSGKVTSTAREPLPGVTVLVKGTTTGTITNSDGGFVLSNVPPGATLVFSFVGMKTQEIEVGGKTSINVTLDEETVGIEEVVAIGYGTKMKGELTGSVVKADQHVFEAKPITSTLNALQGAMPGVTVTKGSGRPGRENYNFQIRGFSSVAGSSPLVLIDGIAGDLNTLNPNDILNVTVLKDAAASIYGARAADGVLIVTTKNGQKGKPTVSYSFNYGIKTPDYIKEMTNTLEMAEMYDEGMRNIGQQGVTQQVFDKIKANAEPDVNGGWMKYLENYPGFYGNTNWTDEIFGNGYQQSHNVSISGGGEENSYLFSAGYIKDGGILNYGTEKSETFNVRSNFSFKLFNRLNVETRIAIDNRAVTEPSGVDGILWLTNLMWSYLPIYNPGGKLYAYQGYSNPVQILKEGGTAKGNSNKYQTNVKADWKIFNDLKIVGQIGLNLGIYDGNTTRPTYLLTNWQGGLQKIESNPNSATFQNTKNLYGSYTAYLEYNKTLFGKHEFTLMGGASHEQNDYQSQSITGYNFTSNDIFTLNLADKTNVAYMNYTGSASDWALNSFFGRLSYAFDKKLFLDVTTRLDGSSKFAPSARWSALFPAVSGAWNLTQEDFIQSLHVFDLLKLRASWGQSGNQNLSFGNYDYIPLISISGKYPLGSPNVGLPGAVASIASESRTWETVEISNAGIDFAFLNSRLTGSFDYFIKQNNNMLVSVTLPVTLGGTAPTQNVGTLKTNGWEGTAGWNDKKGDFKYSVSFIVSDNKTELVELKGNDNYWEGLVPTRKGYPLNSYFGYESDGFIQNAEELADYRKLGNIPTNIGIGDAKYKDLDGDGKITSFGDPTKGLKGDMKYLGDRNPRYTYSSNINLSYKNFEFGMLLQGVGKRDGIRTGTLSRAVAFVFYQPPKWFYGKTWTPERPDAKYPRIIPGSMGWDALQNWNYRTSDREIVSLAYMRIKSLTLAYNIPESICSRLKMQSIRVYASGQDLITLSKGTWGNSYDPEEERTDYQTYPFTKVISFGVDVKF